MKQAIEKALNERLKETYPLNDKVKQVKQLEFERGWCECAEFVLKELDWKPIEELKDSDFPCVVKTNENKLNLCKTGYDWALFRTSIKTGDSYYTHFKKI